MFKIKFMACLICMSLLVGCAAGTDWPKEMESKLAQLDKKGLVLSSVTFENKLDETDSILPVSFLIGKKGEDDYEKYHFSPSQHFRVLTFDRTFYLFVLELDPGNYSFYSMRGQIIGDMFRPLFEAPMLESFQAKKNEILYIGNIHLVLREKASDLEHRAGPVIPLLDQASIINATLDVKINDEYEKDMVEFEKVFPNLKDYSVVKKILPPWRRPSPQQFETKKTAMFFW